jgi:pimeloyl-ACP methyl ester carboxylesterase
VIEAPETQYIKTDAGAHIAYQVCGDGPPDLVYERGIGSHVELAWEIAAVARVFRRLASFSRLIRFDHQGMGMSDPLRRSEHGSLEARAAEMFAVLDAVGSERAALAANNFGGPLAILFAATYPNRTASLVLDGCYARLARAPDYPWGIPEKDLEQALARVCDAQLAGDVDDASGLRYLAPHALQDAEFVAQWGRISRYTASPSATAAELEVGVHTDVRALLPLVQAPTLVLYRRDDLFAGRPHA